MPRGFASMTKERHREVSGKGGRVSQEKGTGHRWTSPEEASAAGKKGGATNAAKEGFLTRISHDYWKKIREQQEESDEEQTA